MTTVHATHKSHSWFGDLGHALQRVLRASTASTEARPRWGSYMVRYL